MTEEYSQEQIKRAKELFKVLFPVKADDTKAFFNTTWGLKTNTGIINTILVIMFGKD